MGWGDCTEAEQRRSLCAMEWNNYNNGQMRNYNDEVGRDEDDDLVQICDWGDERRHGAGWLWVVDDTGLVATVMREARWAARSGMRGVVAGSRVVGCRGWEWDHGKERNDGDAVAGRHRLHGGLRNEKLPRPGKIVISLIQVHGNQGRNG
ncbi:hypothetical protein SESBI_24217 [Sesbania bispinosa]|nr:hypothetical protein SESBI_24217 [Sesbania bispinosa]